MAKQQYISIGELARLANTTVRTLQFYDKKDIIKPSKYSEGGRRLYTKNDLSVIHQVFTLKSLGLSLEEIKRYLIKVDSRKDLFYVLEQQTVIVKRQVSKLSKLLESIELLKSDVSTSEDIDWGKYGKMMELVRDNNEYYWLIKFLDEDLFRSIEKVHTEDENIENAADWLKELFMEAVLLSDKGVSPTGKQGMDLALKWWEHVQKYIDGDIGKLQKLFDFYLENNNWPIEFKNMQEKSRDFIEQAIGCFISTNKILEKYGK